ncbi:MAG: hypothetical protein IJ071_10565 [Ruminococcus sp.]|nr:hypothetical protein [Ruminococcus sp.]
MGKKMTWETAAKLSPVHDLNEPVSMLAKPNKFGYRLNVQHPLIMKMYENYKAKVGEKILSDAQRQDFENRAILFLTRKGIAIK